jgi:hypothetical protein
MRHLVAGVIALSGVTLLGGCDTILKDAFVTGTTTYLFTGFFPSLLPTDTESDDSGQAEE